MRVVFLTGHAANSPRRTGFHFWGDILSSQGHEVEWVTVGFSTLSCLKPRKTLPPQPYNRWIAHSSHVRSFVWCPPVHPVNLGMPFLNRWAVPLFNVYPRLLPASVAARIQEADVVITEVGAGLMLIPSIARRNPCTQLIYFAADRLRTVGAHPAIVQAEREALPHFSLIRVPSAVMKDDYDPSLPVKVIPQGVPKALFDAPHANPYAQGKNAVAVGDMLFDARMVEMLSEQFPDWTFHLFGHHAKLGRQYRNVVEYGEMPYDRIIPYLRHADVGLAPYRPVEGSDYIAQSSLKLAQYTYCRLPVVAPDFMVQNRSYIKGYDPVSHDRLKDAFLQAMATDRGKIDTSSILDWNDVLAQMLQ